MMLTFHSSRLFLISIATASALFMSTACGSGGPAAQPPPGELVVSEVARELSPNVSEQTMSELVAGNTQFATDVYQELRQTPGNLFYSPLSISLAMAMTYAGARGNTEAQMADVLHFTLPPENLHPAFNALDLELASRGQGAQGADGEGFRLNIINQTFGQTGYQFVPEYLDLLARHYGAGMALLDFMNDAEGARQAINKWVADVTGDRIENLLPEGSIDDATRLVLTNAVYFNAAWKTPFEPEATAPDTFHTLTGDVTVDMMNGEVESMTHMEGPGYQAIGIPYDGDELRMVLIVPDLGTFEAFEETLDQALLDNVFASLAEGPYGILSMPLFGFRSKVDMVDTFRSLGLTDAFDDNADFSGINGRRNLVITGIFHEAFINVNEAGTEAAAATAVIIGETSLPETFIVDRPFIFAIQDIETNAVLFLGRVVDPSAS